MDMPTLVPNLPPIPANPGPIVENMNSAFAGVMANLKRAGNYLEGFVEGWKELIILLELHKRTTTSTFGTRDSRGPFHQSDFGFDGTRTVTLGKVKSPRLLWQSTANPMVPFDGVPFLICGRKVLECQYGPKRDARRRKPDEKSDDFCKIGSRISRKRGCPATITVRRIVRFPDHALYPEDMGKGKSDWAIREKKADILFRLKTRLRNGQVQGKERFYVQLPCDEAHQLHPTSGEEACMSQKLHPAIIEKIHELVNTGLHDVHQIKDQLHAFVEGDFTVSLGATKEEMSALLDHNNRAYYPTNHDIRNHMYHALQQNKKKRIPSFPVNNLEPNKKRKTGCDNSCGSDYSNGDINEFLRKGFETFSPDSLLNSRPYGITPPKLADLRCDVFYPTSNMFGPSPLEQAQTGLMLDQRLKQEPMYSSQPTTIKSDPVFSDGGPFTSCDQQHLSRDMTADNTAFKSFDSNPMITIGNVIGGANHLMAGNEFAMDPCNPSLYPAPISRSYPTGDINGLYYETAPTSTPFPYMSEPDGYLAAAGTASLSHPYMTSSPTLSHVITPPEMPPAVTPDQVFNPCSRTEYSPRYLSKTLGPCTEVIKASMDLV